MSEEVPKPKRPSRGKVWKPFRVGEPIGRPHAEWAYVTPLFTTGIKGYDLAKADDAVQREVALSWFWSNLRPYDSAAEAPQALSSGGRPLTSGGRRLVSGAIGTESIGALPIMGVRVVALPTERVSALDALSGEFAEILPATLIEATASYMAGDWMWLEPPLEAGGLSPDELRAAATASVDRVADLLRGLIPQFGEAGHNLPDDELPITRAEQAAALSDIALVRAGLSAPTAPLIGGIAGPWARVLAIVGKVAAWAFKHCDTFIGGAMAEGGKTAGKWGVRVIGTALAAHQCGLDTDHLIKLFLAMKGG